ncbi:MAG TPA: FtsX-like permease family protein, partial [Burkholderiales bacterium]|nr:FtsX-like permease family protein [Burkholderiales bacterium]
SPTPQPSPVEGEGARGAAPVEGEGARYATPVEGEGARDVSWLRGLALSLRMLVRDARAGELRVLVVGLLIAVSSLTTVAFFADRVRQALSLEASQLLGADLVVVSDHPLDPALAQEAARRGLNSVETVRFPSMTLREGRSQLSEIKAVGLGYPLKGRLTIDDGRNAVDRPAGTIPAPGTVWVDERLLARLDMRVGDSLALGTRMFRVAARLTEEPETTVGFLNLGPRLIMNLADLPSTGLIQVGSRVTYRLGVAGAAPAVQAFRGFAQSRSGPGQRVEDVRDARPEIRSALERAEKFLGLSALLSVLLAAVAVALAARRYLRRHLDGCAIMRCLGASQRLILRLYVQQFVALGFAASAAGCALGFAGQAVLSVLLQPLVGVDLPLPGLVPVLQGFVAGFVLLLGFAIPPLVALRKVPTLRVLRRDLGLPDTAGLAGYGVGVAALAALILWEAQDPKVGVYVLGGGVGTMAVSAVVTWALMRAFAWTGARGGFAWRFGLANLRRRPLATITQVVALGVGIMALVLLTLVRGDLLATWQKGLPPDAPNRFLVNIQPDQLAALQAFFRDKGLQAPELFPMVRGRLVARNGMPVSSADYPDDRAKRLIDREFNLSWALRMQPDNVLVAGHWWSEADRGQALFSVEEGIAHTLGIKMGDKLTYDVAGSELEGSVASLRKVEWDSFRVNFFVVAPPGVLDAYPASYVTSFHLAPDRSELMDQLVRQFPNFLVIDVAAVLGQVQRIMDQVVKAVEFVFLFGLVAGLVVLFAAISATHDERVFDAAIMRTVGATGRQMLSAHAAEFAAIGALAGLLAAIGASLLGWVLAAKVLSLPYSLSLWVWLVGLVGGTAGVLLSGLLGTRRVIRTPPMEIFREAG